LGEEEEEAREDVTAVTRFVFVFVFVVVTEADSGRPVGLEGRGGAINGGHPFFPERARSRMTLYSPLSLIVLIHRQA